MPVEAATNCWTNAEDALVGALPELAEFRTYVGAANSAAAAKKIFLEETDKPADGHADGRPEREARGSFAIVSSDQGQPYSIEQGRAGDFYGSGRLVLSIERLVPEIEWLQQETDNASSGQVYRWTKNRTGTLINQLVDYWAENGGPYLRRASVLGPLENDPETWENEGRWHFIEITIEWGLATQ